MSDTPSALQTLMLAREGPVLHVTFNRPQQRNAMSQAMVRELRLVLAEAEATESTVRAVVLRGAGGHFCAGADLKDMAAARDSGDGAERALRDANAAFGELCAAFAATRLALLAVVEGSAMGGGVGLACVADVTLAGTSAVFRLPETSLGIVPAQIAPYLVERLGYAEARRLAVTGGRIDADAALQLRLVHAVHAAGALDRAVHNVLGEILQCAPGAIAATKVLMAKARLSSPASLVGDAADAFARAAVGDEGVEGAAAFAQKRKPAWAP